MRRVLFRVDICVYYMLRFCIFLTTTLAISVLLEDLKVTTKIGTVRPQTLCIFDHSTVLKMEVSKSKSSRV